MKHDFDVIVIGGGVVGLTAALSVSQQGYSVAILDAGEFQTDRSKPDLRVYAINQSSKALFQSLGIWDNIDAAAVSPYHHMYVWDDANQAAIEFDARLVANHQLGAIIEESAIKEALLQAIQQQKNIDLWPKQTVCSVHSDENGTKIASESENWQAKLLIICDGAQSPTRSLLQIPLTSWSYHNDAIVAMIETEKAHEQTAWQVFLKQGPLAFLPLKNEKHCSIVWSTSPQEAKRLMALEDSAFNEALTSAFSAKLGQAKLLSRRHQFPLTMRQAKQYSGKNWLLAGDAAHTIHPLAGLGLNLGLADIACLNRNLAGLQDKYYFKKVLSAYQRERKAETWKIILLMDAIKTLFTSPYPPVKTLRGLGLNLFNQSSSMKKALIQQAMTL